MTDGQESTGQQPTEPQQCECGCLDTFHKLPEGGGPRGACSNSACGCKRFAAAPPEPSVAIQPTDEMVAAYVAAWKERLFREPQDVDRPAVRAGLAAVLAVIARDYCLERRGHVWHPLSHPTNQDGGS